VNRTLIADQTNRAIRDKAPASYLTDAAVFPHEPEQVLPLHFVDDHCLAEMAAATKDLSSKAAAETYQRFCDWREQAIVERVRDVCAVHTSASTSPADDD
jgi:hypothetical protein